MIRVQRKRTKGYKTPENTKYVGRPTKFGNPFRLTKDGYIESISTNRDILDRWIVWSIKSGFKQKDIVDLYELWIKGDLQKNYPYLPTPPKIDELKGKDLSCFCSLSVPCHVDVLLKQLRNY